ncbi:hypothetical protein TWF696_006525 [Orbilia brochopaga]|uniref:Uncharacterized protein n=1 Tax=Orbilia brochopaga TaxID=3140254 RepID=A0AAV9UZN7_9PEZI
MPPFRIHPPRSVLTTSIFSTTAVISFLVVAAPHILPCPADARGDRLIADNGKQQQQVKKRRKCPMPRPNSGPEEKHVEGRVTIVKEGEASK